MQVLPHPNAPGIAHVPPCNALRGPTETRFHSRVPRTNRRCVASRIRTPLRMHAQDRAHLHGGKEAVQHTLSRQQGSVASKLFQTGPRLTHRPLVGKAQRNAFPLKFQSGYDVIHRVLPCTHAPLLGKTRLHPRPRRDCPPRRRSSSDRTVENSNYPTIQLSIYSISQLSNSPAGAMYVMRP